MEPNKNYTPPASVAKKDKRESITTYAGLVEAVHREVEKLRAVDVYLNDNGKCRLRACRQILFLMDFCNNAKELDDMELHHELGDDAYAARDVLMAVDRIAEAEEANA